LAVERTINTNNFEEPEALPSEEKFQEDLEQNSVFS